MHDAHVSCQRIAPAECLFFRAQMASDLLLAVVVDRVLMPRQIVAAAEDGVARLPRLGIDIYAPVWPGSVVAGDVVGRSLCIVRGGGWGRRCGCILRRSTVDFPTVLLKFDGGVEARMAIRSGAGVGA